MIWILLGLFFAAAYERFGASSSGVPNGAGGDSAPSPAPNNFMRLTASQIAQLAINAGFTGADLTNAVAVAFAESSGNPVAYNPETQAKTPEGEGSFGLWQIYRHAHPEFSAMDLYDPQTNANAAYSVYSGAGYSFRPWSTFKSGAYVAHLTESQNGIDAILSV